MRRMTSCSSPLKMSSSAGKGRRNGSCAGRKRSMTPSSSCPIPVFLRCGKTHAHRGKGPAHRRTGAQQRQKLLPHRRPRQAHPARRLAAAPRIHGRSGRSNLVRECQGRGEIRRPPWRPNADVGHRRQRWCHRPACHRAIHRPPTGQCRAVILTFRQWRSRWRDPEGFHRRPRGSRCHAAARPLASRRRSPAGSTAPLWMRRRIRPGCGSWKCAR